MPALRSQTAVPWMMGCVLAFLTTALLVSCNGDDDGTKKPEPPPGGANDFSGERALEHVKTLVGFGPRPVGSPALDASRDYIEKVLSESGWQVDRQSFQMGGPGGVAHSFVNLRARFPGKGEDIANIWNRGVTTVVASHYDTKMFSDFTFVGANDGGSSTGALLEIARVMSSRRELAPTLELIFFDGEEAFGPDITPRDGLYGSRYYKLFLRSVPADQRPRWGVLLDMIGDKNLTVTLPINTPKPARRAIFQAARKLGVSGYFNNYPREIIDDHVPMNEAGIKTVDVIDMEYDPYWHTREDTMDKISATSLEIVGRTVVVALEEFLPPRK